MTDDERSKLERMREAERNWEDFLNPDVVREKFAAVGLFLVAYEILAGRIRDKPLGFFAAEFKNGVPVPSDEYKAKVLALDPKGKCDPKRGGIEWLNGMGAIDETDRNAIREVTDLRNEVAHELPEIVVGGSLPAMNEHLSTLLELIEKIDRWWIVNVEIPTNSDCDGEDIDESKIVSVLGTAMSILRDVAMGKEEEAWAYYRDWLASRARAKVRH